MGSAVGVDVGCGVNVEVGSTVGVDVGNGVAVGVGNTTGDGTHAPKIRALSATKKTRRQLRRESKELLVDRVKSNILPAVVLHISIVKRHGTQHSNSEIGTDVVDYCPSFQYLTQVATLPL